MIVPNYTKQFFMQAGSILNVLSTLYFSPQSILPLCTLESLNYECRSATHEFMQTLLQYWNIQHNQSIPTQSNQFHKIIFHCEKQYSSHLCPLPPFPSFLLVFHFFFSGKDVNVVLKGDLPCFQHFSIQERSLCSIRSICHYEFWSHPCLSSGFPHCYGFNLIIAPAFPHPVQGRLCLD